MQNDKEKFHDNTSLHEFCIERDGEEPIDVFKEWSAHIQGAIMLTKWIYTLRHYSCSICFTHLMFKLVEYCVALWLPLLIEHFNSSAFCTSIICSEITEPTSGISLTGADGESNPYNVNNNMVPTLTVAIHPPNKSPTAATSSTPVEPNKDTTTIKCCSSDCYFVSSIQSYFPYNWSCWCIFIHKHHSTDLERSIRVQ